MTRANGVHLKKYNMPVSTIRVIIAISHNMDASELSFYALTKADVEGLYNSTCSYN